MTRARAQSCQAVMTRHCAHACRGILPGQAPALTYAGVHSCQAPALTRTMAQSCQALMALHCAHACGGIQPGQALALTYAGVQPSVLAGPSSDPCHGPALSVPDGPDLCRG